VEKMMNKFKLLFAALSLVASTALAQPVGYNGNFYSMGPYAPTLIPNGSIFLDSTNNNALTLKGISGGLYVLSGGAPGSSGSIIFNNGSALTGDSNILYNGSQVSFDVTDNYGGLHILGRAGGEASISLQPDTVSNGSAGQWIFYTAGSQLNSSSDFAIFDSQTGAPAMVFQSATGNVGIGTNDPSVALQVAGTIKATAFSGPFRTSSIQSSNFTLPTLTTDYILNMNTASGALTATLADATASANFCVDTKNTGSHILSVSALSGQTIDGSATVTLNPNDSKHLCAVGGEWSVY
jgi:hypothetical protein